jgi:hypothetical protein
MTSPAAARPPMLPRPRPRSKLRVLQAQLHVATYTSESVPALRGVAAAIDEEEAAARAAVEQVGQWAGGRAAGGARGGGGRGRGGPRPQGRPFICTGDRPLFQAAVQACCARLPPRPPGPPDQTALVPHSPHTAPAPQVSAQLLAYRECGPEFGDIVWQYGQVKVSARAPTTWRRRGPARIGSCPRLLGGPRGPPAAAAAAASAPSPIAPAAFGPAPPGPPPPPPQEELRKVEHALHHFSQLEREMELTGP